MCLFAFLFVCVVFLGEEAMVDGGDRYGDSNPAMAKETGNGGGGEGRWGCC